MFDFSNTRINLRRSIFSYAKVESVIGSITRNRKLFLSRQQIGKYLNIGCGKNIAADFINLDYCWHVGIDVCWDVKYGLPLPDRYVGGIFSEHMLEHIDFDSALELLLECRRVMCPGGTIRIIVPDGELYLTEYARHLAGNAPRIPYIEDDASKYPFVTPIICVNRIFRSHGHQFIWDFETLRLSLLHAGFENVKRRTFNNGSDPILIRDTPTRQLESLYVEAERMT